MAQSITTTPYRVIRAKYHGPTNTRGARIIADAGDSKSRVTVSYDYSASRDERFIQAARAVVEKMGWNTDEHSDLVGGDYNGDAYYFVWTPKE